MHGHLYVKFKIFLNVRIITFGSTKGDIQWRSEICNNNNNNNKTPQIVLLLDFNK